MRHTIRDIKSYYKMGRIVSVMRGSTIVLSIWIDLSGEHRQVCYTVRSCAQQQSLRAYIADKYPDIVWGNLVLR